MNSATLLYQEHHYHIQSWFPFCYLYKEAAFVDDYYAALSERHWQQLQALIEEHPNLMIEVNLQASNHGHIFLIARQGVPTYSHTVHQPPSPFDFHEVMHYVGFNQNLNVTEAAWWLRKLYALLD